MSLLSIISQAGWPIWPLVVCSIAAVTLIVERFISLQSKKIIPQKLFDEAIMVSKSAIPSSDVINKLESNSELGILLASGLRTLQANPRATLEDITANMQYTGRSIVHRLERFLTALATIASAAPLLGLLGTVIGMIEIFGAQPTAGSSSNPAQLASGISIALYNTAFGLMIAIPALIFWRYFRVRIDSYILQLEQASDRFSRHLSQFIKR